jgi:hypothetical protein
MKIKLNKIHKMNIIHIVLILIIFLGIIVIYKNYTQKYTQNNNIKEGLTPAGEPEPYLISPTEANALAGDIESTVNSKLTAAGVPTTVTSEMSAIFNQLNELVVKEVSFSRDKEDSIVFQDKNTPVQNTVNLSPLMDTTFFKGVKFSDSFCEMYNSTNKTELNEKCSILAPESCNSTDCCVLVDGKKCVAGNENGPYMISNNTTDYDYYLHKYNCYGDC